MTLHSLKYYHELKSNGQHKYFVKLDYRICRILMSRMERIFEMDRKKLGETLYNNYFSDGSQRCCIAKQLQ